MQDDIPNFRELQQTLVDYLDLMAVFVGCANGNEQPPESMIEAASKSKEELAKHHYDDLFFKVKAERREKSMRRGLFPKFDISEPFSEGSIVKINNWYGRSQIGTFNQVPYLISCEGIAIFSAVEGERFIEESMDDLAVLDDNRWKITYRRGHGITGPSCQAHFRHLIVTLYRDVNPLAPNGIRITIVPHLKLKATEFTGGVTLRIGEREPFSWIRTNDSYEVSQTWPETLRNGQLIVVQNSQFRNPLWFEDSPYTTSYRLYGYDEAIEFMKWFVTRVSFD